VKSSWPLAGVALAHSQMQLLLLATVASLASNLGSIPAYWRGRRRGGRPMVERYGRWMCSVVATLIAWISSLRSTVPSRARRTNAAYRAHFIAFPAGVAKMSQARFHIYTFIALVALVLCAGVCRHEAGRNVEQQSAVQGDLPPLPLRRGGCAGRGLRLVRRLALEGAHPSDAAWTLAGFLLSDSLICQVHTPFQ